MDPVTHALFGSLTARAALTRPLGKHAWLPGAAGALLPDADALIRSSADPLLYAEFHRHFTHALAFIPIGGALAAVPWMLARRTRAQWQAYWGAATAGYATHGLLDAGTTYGTLLLWPFSAARVAWNVIAIVDPLFTLVLLAGVVAAVRRNAVAPAIAALAVCVAYLAAGAVQRDRAMDAQSQIAAARGHARSRGAVFPAFATNVVWRSLYEADGVLRMDRVRVPWFGGATWSPGPEVRAVTEADLPADVRDDPRRRRDFERFHWFTRGWVARAPRQPEVIADARYSSSSERFEPVWGIRFRPAGAAPPVEWIDRSAQRRIDPRALWEEIRGADPGYRNTPRY